MQLVRSKFFTTHYNILLLTRQLKLKLKLVLKAVPEKKGIGKQTDIRKIFFFPVNI